MAPNLTDVVKLAEDPEVAPAEAVRAILVERSAAPEGTAEPEAARPVLDTVRRAAEAVVAVPAA